MCTFSNFVCWSGKFSPLTADIYIRVRICVYIYIYIYIYIDIYTHEGVSKSPRTMLITRKSLVVHEFPTRMCCGGVLRVSVPSGCGSV